VWVFVEMFESKRACDDLAAGIEAARFIFLGGLRLA
jgi:hypothetical protein